MAATPINFYKGAKAKYVPTTHIGFYVSTDTDELFFDGKSLGDIIKSYSFDTSGKLTLTMNSGKTVEITFPDAVASVEASEGVEAVVGQAGLLSAADKAKIDKMDASLEEAINTLEDALAELEKNIISKCIVASKETAADAQAVLETLPEGYRTLEEVARKLSSFLIDTDATDKSINKWKEIEAFLQGIQDTDSLTDLLAEAGKIYITEVE